MSGLITITRIDYKHKNEQSVIQANLSTSLTHRKSINYQKKKHRYAKRKMHGSRLMQKTKKQNNKEHIGEIIVSSADVLPTKSLLQIESSA